MIEILFANCRNYLNHPSKSNIFTPKTILREMNIQELKINYKKLLKKANNANGRKETVSYLNRAAKIKSKIYTKTKLRCIKCNGAGFLRVSLDETRTCLLCYGKGFLIKEVQ